MPHFLKYDALCSSVSPAPRPATKLSIVYPLMRSCFDPLPPPTCFDFLKDSFEWSAYAEEEEEKDEDKDDGGDSSLVSHTPAFFVLVGVLQGSGSAGSAANSLFGPYNADIILASDVVYDVGEIPSLVRATRKFLILPDRKPTNPPASAAPPKRLPLLLSLGIPVGSGGRRRKGGGGEGGGR